MSKASQSGLDSDIVKPCLKINSKKIKNPCQYHHLCHPGVDSMGDLLVLVSYWQLINIWGII